MTENKKVKEFILQKWRRKPQEDWQLEAQLSGVVLYFIKLYYQVFPCRLIMAGVVPVHRMPMGNGPCCQSAGPAL